LDLVDNHQAVQRLKRNHGLREPLQIDRIFKVEVGALPLGSNNPCESRFPALPWPEQRHGRRSREAAGYAV
jgi:hypothetical protein